MRYRLSGNIQSTMITGALPHLAGLIPNHEVCLIDENVETIDFESLTRLDIGLDDRGGGIGGSAKSGDRGGLGDRSGVKGAGAGSGDRLGSQSNAGGRGGGSRDIGGGREAGAFQGLGKGGDVRNASSRGAASRASGGGARAGEGARSGGRGS